MHVNLIHARLFVEDSSARTHTAAHTSTHTQQHTRGMVKPSHVEGEYCSHGCLCTGMVMKKGCLYVEVFFFGVVDVFHSGYHTFLLCCA